MKDILYLFKMKKTKQFMLIAAVTILIIIAGYLGVRYVIDIGADYIIDGAIKVLKYLVSGIVIIGLLLFMLNTVIALLYNKPLWFPWEIMYDREQTEILVNTVLTEEKVNDYRELLPDVLNRNNLTVLLTSAKNGDDLDKSIRLAGIPLTDVSRTVCKEIVRDFKLRSEIITKHHK